VSEATTATSQTRLASCSLIGIWYFSFGKVNLWLMHPASTRYPSSFAPIRDRMIVGAFVGVRLPVDIPDVLHGLPEIGLVDDVVLVEDGSRFVNAYPHG
jgi:hypothetical protein